MLVAFSIVLAAGLVGGATFAWFTSEDAVADNIIIAGDLDMSVTRVHDNPAPEPAYEFTNIQPGDKAGNWGTTPGMTELTWDIKNEGSIDGYLSAKIDDVDGMLRMKIRPQYWRDGKWVWESGSIVEGNIFKDFPLAAGEKCRLHVTWAFGTTAGDEYQGEQVTFDTVFVLTQEQP